MWSHGSLPGRYYCPNCSLEIEIKSNKECGAMKHKLSEEQLHDFLVQKLPKEAADQVWEHVMHIAEEQREIYDRTLKSKERKGDGVSSIAELKAMLINSIAERKEELSKLERALEEIKEIK
jgi:Mg2+ and Co2+ transporter CorA